MAIGEILQMSLKTAEPKHAAFSVHFQGDIRPSNFSQIADIIDLDLHVRLKVKRIEFRCLTVTPERLDMQP